jgi:hypothetical protein
MPKIRNWFAALTGAALLGAVLLHPPLTRAVATLGRAAVRTIRGTIALAGPGG